MRTTSRRIGLVAAALFLVATSVPAQAVEYLCGDICQCWVGCTRRCTDDISGYSTTCGAAGYPCNGQCLVALSARIEADPAAEAVPSAASEACQVAQTPGPIFDTLPQP